MVINWTELKSYELANKSVDAPWLMVIESVGDATHLKIEAEGQWNAPGSVLPACGADGLAGIVLPDNQLILSGCRFGALIGKFGGSSAIHHTPAQPGVSPAADEAFAIGTFCLLKLPVDTLGPLFVGFNAISRPMQVAALKVKVSGARPTT
jgi:hypothetical protein